MASENGDAEPFARRREDCHPGRLHERVDVLLLPHVVPEIDSVRYPEVFGPRVQRSALRPVPDDPAGDWQPLRVQQRHALQEHVDVLVRQQPAHRDKIDPRAVGIGVPDSG